ncbi:MAG TPA: hypothetical protein VNO26_03180 [Candidatus Limnocylindria bacterium]|nr:hypothetical protein [Candidatus Limnocylindria bacterium]
MVTAIAPGKLFLTGEYAVLRGAPALVAAVNRYARVRFDAGHPSLAIDSRAEGTSLRGADLEPQPAPGGDVGAVLAVARALRVQRGRLEVESGELLAGGQKLGLGRSAATIVAAAAAILAERGERARDAILRLALEANRRFQGGQGSGGDVAAAVHGGVVQVRRTAAGLAVEPSRVPRGLELVVAWSGAGAHTVPLVAKFETTANGPVLGEIAAAAEAAADAAARDDATAFCAAVARSGALLADLGRELDLPIVTPALAHLVDVAARLGIAAKPSGAGAGDCAIAFARSPAEAEALRAAWRDAGFRPLALSVAAWGVHVE